jgi:general secretion pathway protein A
LLLLAVYQPWEVRVPAAGAGTSTLQADTPAAASMDVQPETPEVTAPELQVPVDSETGADTGEPAGVAVRSLGELLLASDSSFYRAAWTELLALWSVILPQSVQPDFCDFAPQYGLVCKHGQGNWNILRQFDRPAMLTLIDADGRRVPVVLVHLDDTLAELMIGTELYRLDVEQVDRYWYGEYLLLLQTPPGGRLYLKAGDRGADVAWLRRQLEHALDVDIPAADPQLFDYALQKRVLDFQRSQGLVADGIVGENTLIHLNTRSEREGVPRLSP